MISLSKFLSDNLFLLAEILSPAVEYGVQMKNWIDFSCDLVIKLSWCQVVSFSFWIIIKLKCILVIVLVN